MLLHKKSMAPLKFYHLYLKKNLKMNRIFLAIFLCLTTISIFSQEKERKAFNANKLHHSVLGGFQIYSSFDSQNNSDKHSSDFFNIGRIFLYKAEYGISNIWGIGFHTGTSFYKSRYSVNNPFQVYLPFGIHSNFHFFNLVDAKTKRSLRADKIDMYIGVDVGVGVVFRKNEQLLGAHYGPHFGFKYFPKKRVGLNFEVGIGSSMGAIGITIR